MRYEDDKPINPEVLKALRKEALLTQQEFATIAGLSIASVNAMERGLRQPRLETVRKLVTAYSKVLKRKVTAEELYAPTPEPAGVGT